MPLGRNRTNTMKMAPITSGHDSVTTAIASSSTRNAAAPTNGPKNVPGAAQQRHDDDLAGGGPVQRLDRHDGEAQRVERAGQPAEQRVEDEGQVLDARDVVAAGGGAVAVLADRLQHGAERRVEDALERGHREADQHQREVVEDDRVGRAGSEPGQDDGGHRDAPQAVVAAGPVGQVEADEVEELREGQRQHREVDAAPAQAEEAEDQRRRPAPAPAPRRAPATAR